MSLFGRQHKQWAQPPPLTIDPQKKYRAQIRTSRGDIDVDLLPGEAPNTVNNFVFLAKEGFYDGVPFHRILSGFMIQTGDPTGSGRGGPGYKFADEPIRRPYNRGTVAMANSGPNTNGSQFFIMHQNYRLPPNYTIFGQVTKGLEVLDAIATAPVKPSASGEASQPQRPDQIESVTVNEV